ncbi:MAG: hypothetical protein HY553_22040 [Elusimicrobia bacterium]|nr:hypothetical protein [Elusimicrobiota bacterium]
MGLSALAALVLASGAGAQTPELASSSETFVSPSTATYARTEGTIDRVYVFRTNVFDPNVRGEDWWPFRIANRIHVMTREHVVRRELLVGPDDRWDPIEALESERNLRSSGFIRKAEIRPMPKPGGKLDLGVETQDSWTLQPQVSVGTEGGDRYFLWGVEENNLLGLGKAVSLFHGQFGSQKRNEARYRDPRLAGSRHRLTGLYAQTDKGDEIGALIDRPFFSLRTPWAMSLLWTRIIQQDTLYADALETSKFLQHYASVQASVGARLDTDDDPVQRVGFGTHYERSRFERTVDTQPGTLPGDRTLSGPTLGYSLIQPRFVKETYIDKMQRVEDFNLGNELSIWGGPMLDSWGSDRDRWILRVQDQQGYHVGEGRFFLGQAGVAGRVAGGRLENSLAYGSLNAFWKMFWPFPQTWVVHAEANAGHRLDGEHQLVLGGNTGLRGYKNNSFTGLKSALVNVENRVFSTREYFHLVHVGAVAFFETGAIAGDGWGFRDSRFKSDVGFGLRFAPSRSATGSVLRVDAAYALNDGPGASRWVVSIRGGQAFQIFNSTNRNVLRSPSANLGEESAGSRLRRQ